MKKTLIALFAFAALLALVLTFAVFAGTEERSGAVFAADEFYRSTKTLTEIPHTFEAWVKVDKDASSSELGVIVGNYKDGGTHSYGMEVRKNGNPYLWLGYGATGTRGNFDKIDLRTGEWTHVAITYNATNAYCYINGELAQTLTLTCKDVDMSKTGVVCLGGDLRSKNARWLKSSELSTVAVFSDMRTEEEIKADMKKVDPAADALQVSYDLSPTDDSRLTDASPNGNDLVYSGTLWQSTSGNDTEPEEGGMTFNSDPYELTEIIDKPIYTLEATVYFPKNYLQSERGGVIIGNYNVTLPCVNFEIYSNGSPRLYITNESGTVTNFVFDNVNVYNGKWTHIAIVKEADNQLSCYINGELKQTITKTVPDVLTTDVHVLGGDQRSGNPQYFRGRLKSVALYSDARTAEEIKADMTAIGKDDLICGFELDGIGNPDIIPDISENGNNAKLKRAYFTEKAPLAEYAYSFAVLGDTQILALNYPEKYTALYDWVLDSVESKKIKYVIGLGDITNNSTDTEFELAKTNILRMNGVVPYSLVRGNHDTVAQMNKYFPASEFGANVTGTYDANSIINSYTMFSVGEVKYLLFTLDYGASDAVLNWAAGIIEANPDYNVIITTHAYLYRDGTTLDSGDVCPPATTGGSNNGDHMWDKLIKKYENIVLVLSGHDPCDKVICTQTEGDNGNIVTQFLIDPQGVDSAQGGIGLACMFYFSEDGKTLQVEYYSTDKKAYFMEENQFTVTLDLADPKPAEPEAIQLEGTKYGSGMENWVNSSNKPEGHPAVFEILYGAKYDDNFNYAIAEMAFNNKQYLEWTLYISKNADMTDATTLSLAPASWFDMGSYACFRFETALAEDAWAPEVGVTYYINVTVKGDGIDYAITGPADGFVMNEEPITKDYEAPEEPVDPPVDPGEDPVDPPVDPGEDPGDEPGKTGDEAIYATIAVAVAAVALAVILKKKRMTI